MAVNVVYISVFIIYLLLVLAIGAWGYRKGEDVEDFWVYGKELGLWLATWSFCAAFVSAASVIGFIGAIYGGGYSFMTGVILGLMLGVSGLYFVVGKIRELDKITFPDIIADVTGVQMSRPVTAAILLANGWFFLIMQLVGASLLVTTITGVPYKYMVWVIGFVFITYTVLGGLVSVAWTDLVQGPVMVGAVLVTFLYMVVDLGGIAAINTRFAQISAGNVAPLGDGAYTGIGLAATILAFFGTLLTTQRGIIRINATKDIKTAKLHIAIGGVILSMFYVFLVLLGGATTVALTSAGLAVENVDRAFPVLMMEYLPTALGSVLIVAVMSAILSTTDTALHSVGVTTSRDIYDYFATDPSDERLLTVSRLSTIFWGITATAAAVNPPGTIITIYNLRAVLLTSGLLIPVYIALYNRNTFSGRALITSMSLGGASGIGWELMGGTFGIPATFVGVGFASISLLVVHLIDTRIQSPQRVKAVE
ncbi:sodium:solute symporter family protein [Halopenitus persicus]|uniref:sodium:solute symporter family protein n=1 Tax=Halopenitus persicus TaxID=1048396 RepID=UPI000BBB3D29|nr:sodium:solute symporter family protein [Halopenitus persicus]